MTANYIVSVHTKAILNTDNTYYKARIYEGSQMWNHIHKAENILQHNCMLNGASLSGRRNYAKETLQSPVKLPIPVNPKMGIFMVPTSSPKSMECVWTSYYHVDTYMESDGQTYIYFRDGTGMYVDVSVSAFHNQMMRTAHLIAQLNRPIHF